MSPSSRLLQAVRGSLGAPTMPSTSPSTEPTKTFQPPLQSSSLAPAAPVDAACESHTHASHPHQLGAATTLHASPHPALAFADNSAHSKPRRPTVGSHSQSAPIPIPLPKIDFHAASSFTPITPLTAREAKGAHFPFHLKIPPQPQLGRSLHPRYTQHPHPGRHISHSSDDSASPSSSFGSTGTMPARPSSPLSPADLMPMSPLSPRRPSGNPLAQRPTSRPAPKLQLKSLPRFHPANYESPASSADITPRAPRPGAAQSHGRQVSDSQRLLGQFHRDTVINATRTAALNLSPKTLARPVSPRLYPSVGSPGPMTPLMLEGGEDYLTAGTLSSPEAQSPRGRETIQRMLDKENEHRRPHHRSESHSPAVSPAGGRC